MMKIIFICGTAEPGKDGVGDYTRRLTEALLILGHDVSIISLYDTFVSDVRSENQHAGVSTIHVHRIPFHLDEKTRFLHAQKIINDFNPDWISLQFVIFSFHPKGLPWSLAGKLKTIVANSKIHIMFHELWVGMDQESPFKLKVLSLLQKTIIKKILKQLKPAVIHTHTPLYQWQLNKIGFNASILSLFGNVPVKENKREPLGYRFVVFGSIHFGAPIEAFAKELRSLEHLNNKTPEVVFVGRCGKEQMYWEHAFNDAGITTTSLGEQTVEQISELLAGAAFGITSTPYILTEKSGTVAAMIEHGLPVLCVARDWHVDGYNSATNASSAVMQYKPGYLQTILQPDFKNKRSLADITDQFIRSLK